MDLTAAIANATEKVADTLLPPVAGLRVLDQFDIWNITLASFAADTALPPPKMAAQIASANPVLQLPAFPIPLDPQQYENPVTNTNPNGDYIPLYRFRTLVDPVPSFTRYYNPTPSSIEGSWGDFVNGAAVRGSGYAAAVLANAQQSYSNAALSNLAGLGTWRPVYATPDDWFDLSIPGRFVDIEIDLSDPATQTAFSLIPGAGAGPSWSISTPGQPGKIVALDANTQLQTLHAKAMTVTLSRPWLEFGLLGVDGIYLSGQRMGLYSSGMLNNNDGIMPLLPSGLCIATDVQIQASWSPADSDVLKLAAQNKFQVSLGHFALSSGEATAAQPAYSTRLQAGMISTTAVQVIAWISTLVPLSPRSAG